MDSTSTQSVQDTLINTLTKQLSEFDLLKSMYPNQGDIILTDCNALEDIKNFVDKKSFNMPNHFDYILNLSIDNLKLEINVNLPSLYPNEVPDIFVRCNQLSRQQETYLNSELSQYIKSVQQNEVCLYTAISWLHENIDTIKAETDKAPKSLQTQPMSKKNKAASTFVRHWIFSHHICSKYKREEIIKRGRDLNLTGFCLAGKPGIICVEGTDEDCAEWWKDIKSMNWKKISIRKTENFHISEKRNEQKFEDFLEINFQNSKSGFSKFIKEHNLSQEFSEFLGL